MELKESLRDTPPAGPIVNLCKTYDQAKAVAQFIEALAEKQLKYALESLHGISVPLTLNFLQTTNITYCGSWSR